jgi:hypothetical protein
MDTNNFVLGFLYGYAVAIIFFVLLPNEAEINEAIANFIQSVINQVKSKFHKTTKDKESIPSDEDSLPDAPRCQLALPPAKEEVEIDAPQHQPPELIPSDETSEPEAPQLQPNEIIIGKKVYPAFYGKTNPPTFYAYDTESQVIFAYKDGKHFFHSEIVETLPGWCIQFHADKNSLISGEGETRIYPVTAKTCMTILLSKHNFIPSDDFFPLEEKLLSLEEKPLENSWTKNQ